MADRIIVTVYSEATHKYYDLEMPVATAAGKLAEDIVETISAIEDRTYGSTRRMLLWNDRTRKFLTPEKNLKEQGVRNGDYLYITEAPRSTSN